MWKAVKAARSRAALGLAAAVVVLALTAVACGGNGAQGEGVASVGQGKGAASSGSYGSSGQAGEEGEGQRAKDAEKAMLDFARCMREHGVDMPDPKPGQGDVLRFEAPAAATPVPEGNKFVEAEKACRHFMDKAGPPQLSPEDQKQMQDAMLAFARCMREHGVEMPDPQPGGGGIVARVGEGADPRSAEFQAAEKDCKDRKSVV
jgi:hypothetical protein